MDAQAMTIFHYTERELILYFLTASAWLGVGTVIGAFHFLSLRWNLRHFEAGQSLLLAFAIQLARLALIAVALGVIASQFGALPLLVATAGILAARPAILRFGVQS
jgi:F1F0 ATPase subunit 2